MAEWDNLEYDLTSVTNCTEKKNEETFIKIIISSKKLLKFTYSKSIFRIIYAEIFILLLSLWFLYFYIC